MEQSTFEHTIFKRIHICHIQNRQIFFDAGRMASKGRHVPISLSPEGPGHLDIHGVVDAVHEGGAGDEVMLQVVLDMSPPG